MLNIERNGLAKDKDDFPYIIRLKQFGGVILILNFYGTDEDVVSQLNKYLLKTLCTEITNCIFSSIATEQMMAHSESSDMTADVSFLTG